MQGRARLHAQERPWQLRCHACMMLGCADVRAALVQRVVFRFLVACLKAVAHSNRRPGHLALPPPPPPRRARRALEVPANWAMAATSAIQNQCCCL